MEARTVSKQKFSDLVSLSQSDLQDQLKTAKTELFQLRFQLATKQLENTARIGETRHRIAQLMTALRAKELTAAGGNP
jgi:large subunit ribosomal protein L29